MIWYLILGKIVLCLNYKFLFCSLLLRFLKISLIVFFFVMMFGGLCLLWCLLGWVLFFLLVWLFGVLLISMGSLLVIGNGRSMVFLYLWSVYVNVFIWWCWLIFFCEGVSFCEYIEVWGFVFLLWVCYWD